MQRDIRSDNRRSTHRLTFSRAFVFAFAGTIAGLVALAELNGAVSTGWRLFVLDRVLKAAWAVTITILAAASSQLVIGVIAGGRRRSGTRGLVRDLAGLAISIVIAAGALGYFLPDWTRLTIMAGAVTLLFWVVAVLAAL
jgi:hypothetical protein